MDEQEIDMQVLSINPYWYATGRDVAERLIRIQNERLAEVCAANSERFAGLATVALQFPELAAEQLVEGVKKFGLRGVSIIHPAPAVLLLKQVGVKGEDE